VFSDTLDRLYNSATTMKDSQDVGMIEILLVLAIGRQILRKTSPQEFSPGDKLFKVAIARLPNFTELRTKGIIMVNILALAAVYLQNLDLTEDAYYYVRCSPCGQ
jgi:proline utilization trans-activator